MANYVERDGDWVLRPPGRLEQITMHLFLLRAGANELQALCDRFINIPTGNAVKAEPVFKGFPLVLLTVADIAKGYSKDPDDAGHGWMTERDVGFFIPADLTWGGNARVANLLPYLYVDNFPAVLIGREIFGFPKVLADIQIGGTPWQCTVTSTVQKTNDPTKQAGSDKVVGVVRQTPSPGLPLPAKLDDALTFLIDHVRQVLGMPPSPSSAFTKIAMVFLKQFRDAVLRTVACHQSVVLAEATITDFRGGELWLPVPLLPFFEVDLPPYYSVSIAQTLGLGASPIRPLLAVRVEIDFELGFGSTLWTAP